MVLDQVIGSAQSPLGYVRCRSLAHHGRCCSGTRPRLAPTCERHPRAFGESHTCTDRRCMFTAAAGPPRAVSLTSRTGASLVPGRAAHALPNTFPAWKKGFDAVATRDSVRSRSTKADLVK